MRVGNIVQNLNTGEYGSVHYSSFGISIHFYREEGQGKGVLCKTLGGPVSEFEQDWKVVRRMPKGYQWDESKLFIRRKQNV